MFNSLSVPGNDLGNLLHNQPPALHAEGQRKPEQLRDSLYDLTVPPPKKQSFTQPPAVARLATLGLCVNLSQSPLKPQTKRLEGGSLWVSLF